jgi:hypothetical protein
MFLALFFISLLSAQPSLASVRAGTPCQTEGEIAEVIHGDHTDVYVCRNGRWAFLRH